MKEKMVTEKKRRLVNEVGIMTLKSSQGYSRDHDDFSKAQHSLDHKVKRYKSIAFLKLLKES